MKKTLAVILAMLMALLMLVGCGTTGTTGTTNSVDSANGSVKDTFSIISTEPVTLNLVESDSNLDEFVFYLTSTMLYRPINGEYKPEMVESMEVSEDGTVYTYKIREGYYSDGTQIKAEDFVYYINRKYISATNYNYFVGGEEAYNNADGVCEGIYAVDDTTFVMTLVEPYVGFNGIFVCYPLQKAFAEEKGAAMGGTPADFLYSGPYILNEWVVGSSMTFAKNDTYVDADTLFPTENIRIIVSTDVSTAYSLYTNGDVDAILSVGDELMEMLPQEELVQYSTSAHVGLSFNTTGYTYADGNGFASRGDEVTALMQNENFRKALCAALDRTTLAAATDPTSIVTNRYIDDGTDGVNGKSYVEEYTLENTIPLEGDKTLAESYLAAALQELGYSDVKELPQLSFLTFESAKWKLTSETMIALWKSELGLENIVLDIQPIQSAIMSMVYMNYDLYIQQLSVEVDNPLVYLEYWVSTGALSDVAGFQASGVPSFMASNHNNPEYDTLIKECFKDFDVASRYEKMKQAEQLLYDDYVIFPLYFGGGYSAVKGYVDGYVSAYVDSGYSFANLVVYGN